jgi:hypothetical protein
MKPTKIHKDEVKKAFGKLKDFYRMAGRAEDGYMLRVGIWGNNGELIGATKAERFTRVAHLITAYINHTGSLKGIPQNWLEYAKEQKEDS